MAVEIGLVPKLIWTRFMIVYNFIQLLGGLGCFGWMTDGPVAASSINSSI